MSKDSHISQFDPGKSIIIFDFDGTMVETEQQVVSIINSFRSPLGFKPLTLEMFRNKFPGKKFLEIQVIRLVSPLLLRIIQRKQAKNIKHVRMEPGLLSVMHTLKARGYHLGIISSNSRENVLSYLQAHGLLSLFQFVEVTNNLYGKGELIIKILKKHSYSTNRAVYVGDEVRDVAAAKQAGVQAIAVTWGYQSKKIFEICDPDYLVDTPQEFLRLFVKVPWWKRLFMLKWL